MPERGPDISDHDLLAALRLRDGGATYPEIVRQLGRTERIWQRRLSAIYAEMDDA